VRRLYRGAALILLVILIAFVYQRLFGDEAMTPHLVASQPVALIGGESDERVAVAADGTILTWFPVPEESSLPRLPLATPPQGPRVEGPMLEQVRVLAAVPDALRPAIAGSYYGESGVDVELTSGIELRFGSASQAARKWHAAAAVLADPSLTELDYVDLHAPAHPSVGGSGHALPSIP
jgi:cell division septal protein FtsQ